MDNRNITSIVVNYDNGEIETSNKGVVVGFDEIDNEEETIKVSGHETVHLSIVEGVPKHKIPAHVDLDADKDFRCVLEVRE